MTSPLMLIFMFSNEILYYKKKEKTKRGWKKKSTLHTDTDGPFLFLTNLEWILPCQCATGQVDWSNAMALFLISHELDLKF
jgi:hypothetical protein